MRYIFWSLKKSVLNKKFLVIVFQFILVLIPLNVRCQIYEYTNASGYKVFTNHSPHLDMHIYPIKTQLQDNAFQSQSPQIYDISKNSLNASANSSPQTPSDPGFKINFPKDQQTFWNPKQISIEIEIANPFTEGNSLMILLDGQPYSSSKTSSQFIITDPTPGAHLIQAQLIGTHNEILKKSAAITVFIHIGIASKHENMKNISNLPP